MTTIILQLIQITSVIEEPLNSGVQIELTDPLRGTAMEANVVLAVRDVLLRLDIENLKN